MSSEAILSAKNIFKSYQQGASELKILKGLSLDVIKGEALSIIGASGAGKSTLLHILGTLDTPESGELYYGAKNLLDLEEKEQAEFRNHNLGFVFQFHHLLAEFTALENVMMPVRIGGAGVNEARERAKEVLRLVGVEARSTHYPNQLSGGELQRVAIARALVNSPQILLADEPTGNLDSQNSLNIQELFFDLQTKLGLTLVVVTHDLKFAQRFPRQLKMRDGHWDV